jgi:hypothetical protein
MRTPSEADDLSLERLIATAAERGVIEAGHG